MAQTPCTYRQLGDTIDYNPGSAVLAGTVYVIGTTIVTIVPKDIAADEMGASATRGVFNVPKDNSDVSAGDALYWDADGSPVGGTALSGAFTKTAGGNNTLAVFPQVNDDINLLGANNVYTQATNSTVGFVKYNASRWFTF